MKCHDLDKHIKRKCYLLISDKNVPKTINELPNSFICIHGSTGLTDYSDNVYNSLSINDAD